MSFSRDTIRRVFVGVAATPKGNYTNCKSRTQVRKCENSTYFLVALVLKSTAVLIPHLEVSLGMVIGPSLMTDARRPLSIGELESQRSVRKENGY